MTDHNKTHGVLSPWIRAEQLAGVPAVDDALQVFADDASLDNATGIIVAVLANVAPQSPVAPADERTAFESAIDHDAADCGEVGFCDFTRDADGRYVAPGLESAWWAWQARARLADARPMVDMVPPATSRDRWMYEQGRLAERDPRTPKDAPTASSAEFALRALVAAGHVSADKVREARAIFASLPDAPTVSAKPVATLHDDGSYTYRGDKPDGYNYAGWRMDVYAAPTQELTPAPNQGDPS